MHRQLADMDCREFKIKAVNTTKKSSASESRQMTVINYLLVYLLLFVSGSWRYNLSDDMYLVVAFLIAATLWFIFSDRKMSHGFLLFFMVFGFLLLSLSIYTGGSQSIGSVISAMMKMMLAYLVLKTVGLRFNVIYIKLIVFLAVISLFGYVTDIFSLLDGVIRKLPRVGDVGYEGMLYLYRFPWHITRNNSIFFEPGAYQAFLNAAIFLILFSKTELEKRKKVIYLAILTITLITTYSTTGFMIFIIILLLFFYKSDILSFTGKLAALGVGFVVVIVFSSQFHSSFVTKISDYITADEYDFGGSADTRSSQLKADIKVFSKHVFGLGHSRYLEEFRAAGRTDNKGSSNGVTRILAVYGLPFSVLIFGSYFWAFRKLLVDPVLAYSAFVMYLLFLAGESYYINSPITYSIIVAAFVFVSIVKKEDYSTKQKNTVKL